MKPCYKEAKEEMSKVFDHYNAHAKKNRGKIPGFLKEAAKDAKLPMKMEVSEIVPGKMGY